MQRFRIPIRDKVRKMTPIRQIQIALVFTVLDITREMVFYGTTVPKNEH